MKITEALKEKNKLAAKLQKLWGRLQSTNSILEGSKRVYDPVELLKEIDATTEEIVTLKTNIHSASSPVRSKIFRMSELKNYVTKLKTVSTKDGLIRDRYESSILTMVAVFKENEVDALLEKMENEIEQLQKELDSFNHHTII